MLPQRPKKAPDSDVDAETEEEEDDDENNPFADRNALSKGE